MVSLSTNQQMYYQAGAGAGQSAGWSLVSCVCVPAFSWSQFTATSAPELVSRFPHLAASI